MENEKDTIEIDLLALARAVWKRVWLVIAAVLVCGAAAFSYAKFLITPLYEAKALMYVNNSSISVQHLLRGTVGGPEPGENLYRHYAEPPDAE